MSDRRIYTQNGDLTPYALTCGYVQSATVDNANFYATGADGVALSWNGCTYDVHVRGWSVDSLGVSSRVDWRQFDTLTAARKFFRTSFRTLTELQVS